MLDCIRRQTEDCAINTEGPTNDQSAHSKDGVSSIIAAIVGVLVGRATAQAIDSYYSQPNQKNAAQKRKSAFRDPIVWATIALVAVTAASVTPASDA